ncbi:hypothetical protein [Flavobacterium psychrophilum]|uniref:hypothetical protein n=1 Tax=Flavobacterium psychrophilum TaxID=96345 RepID=UPI00106B2798|nr:hypothetical protein [Flavobacterium psychrophilum]
MKKYFLLIINLICFNIYSQNLKNYVGEYKSGFANYQYFENENYERVFEGNFKYTKDKNLEIKGIFKNNLKVGVWKYTKNYKLKDEELSIFVNGNYIDDRKNGVWTFNRFYSYKGKIENQKISINLKNDTIIGKIKTPNLLGEFDNNGKFIGKWNLKESGYEYIAEFESNVLTKFIYREISNDGKVLYKYTPSLDTLKVDKLKNYNWNEKISKIEYNKLNLVHRGALIDNSDDLSLDHFDNFIEKLKADIYRFQFINIFVQLEEVKIKNPELIIVAKNEK